MPLPEGNPEWPPPTTKKPGELYRKWAAWYSGDPAELMKVYGDTLSTSVADLKNTGFIAPGPGARATQPRMWWGQPLVPGGLREAKLHVPLAGDIASTSADLLFGEPPAVIAEEADRTQKRIEEIVELSGLHSVLHEAAEICAAFGGVYLRAGWDEEVADHPLFDAIPPDAAVPEWRSGRLVAVTFWRKLEGTDGDEVWRHLERHEPGVIWHGLYRGTEDRLGQRMSLTERPETALFAGLVDQAGRADTGAEGLAVEYVPNMRPNRVLRGSALGRSDYSGVEQLMDALDESWSSWMRDLRLGKARLVVPDVYLTSDGRGKGTTFDPEQAIFTTINALPNAEGMSLEQVQFAIRVAEHQQTCTELMGQILRGAGYSVQTFGENGETMATATEVVARERRSYTTRARKINYWRGPLLRWLSVALQIDVNRFKSDGVKPEDLTLEWPDGVATDPEALGRTLQLLHAAEAVSTQTRVTMLHPDWDDQQIDEEVERIEEEKKAGMPEPPLDLDGAAPGEPGGKPGPPGGLGQQPAMSPASPNRANPSDPPGSASLR